MALVSGDHVNLVALHLTRQARGRLAGDDARAQLRGHPLRIVLIQTQFVGDLEVR